MSVNVVRYEFDLKRLKTFFKGSNQDGPIVTEFNKSCRRSSIFYLCLILEVIIHDATMWVVGGDLILKVCFASWYYY